MIKNYSSFDLLDFALEILSIFTQMDAGRQLPSKVGIIQKSIDHMALEEFDEIDRDQLVSIFIASVLGHVEQYCSNEENKIFRRHLILFLLERRDEMTDRAQLVAFLINNEKIELNKYQSLLEDNHVIEHIESVHFSPFIKFWKYSELSSSDWIVLYKLANYDPFALLEPIALGGFQNDINIEVVTEIIPIFTSTESSSSVWKLTEVIKAFANTGKTFKFGENLSGCSIYLDKLEKPAECSIILSEDCIQCKK